MAVNHKMVVDQEQFQPAVFPPQEQAWIHGLNAWDLQEQHGQAQVNIFHYAS